MMKRLTQSRLVKGHNFAFNGETAWRSVKERWMEETSEWTGGNYKCCFRLGVHISITIHLELPMLKNSTLQIQSKNFA